MSTPSSIFDDVVCEPLAHDQLLIDTDEDGITLVQFNSPAVNLFTPTFFTTLNDWLVWLYHDPNTRAVVLTSAIPNIFTGGFDIKDFIDKTPDEFASFWYETQRHWLILNGFRKPTAAVITGTTPGIGCVSVLACDYRVMTRAPCTASGEPLTSAKPFRIGLNECSFGLFVPPYVQDMYAQLLGHRTAEMLSLRGTMLSPEAALEAGLVDELADNKEAGLAAARENVLGAMRTPPVSFQKQKTIVRRRYMEPILTAEGRARDAEEFYEVASNEALQKALSGYLTGLHSKKKPPTPAQ